MNHIEAEVTKDFCQEMLEAFKTCNVEALHEARNKAYEAYLKAESAYLEAREAYYKIYREQRRIRRD